MFSFQKMIVILSVCFSLASYSHSSHLDTLYFGSDSLPSGIYVPTHSKKSSLGVVLWFHGGMRSSNCEKGLLAWKPLMELVDTTQNIIASPSACRNSDWLKSATLLEVENLLQYLKNHYYADLNKLTLVGVSDGTLMVLRYSIQGQNLVQNHVLISSYPMLLLNNDGMIRFAKRLNYGRWNFFQGGKDRLFPSNQVFPFLENWANTFPNTRLFLEPKGLHDYSWWKNFLFPELKSIFFE